MGMHDRLADQFGCHLNKEGVMVCDTDDTTERTTMNVKLIKMMSGEDVICDLIREEGDRLIISNPVIMVPQGQGQVGFAPWSPFLDDDVKELAVRESYSVYITDPKPAVIENYKQIFSTIITPPASGKIITAK